ncbi:MAG: alginate O-acetyltransferase AlgX-related protein [Flavobacteriales bacterium]
MKIENWLNGSYQDSMETYVNEHAGFRPAMVRLNNQLEYHLFDVAKGKEIIIGKNNCLYGIGYIKAATGEDFVGEQTIKDKVAQIKRSSDFLESKGTELVVLLAPGKGTFYPEYIPKRFPKVNDSLNIDYYIKEFENQGVNVIDANSWFREMKDTSEHCLYPLHGIHWSSYGHALVQDSLENYFEALFDLDLPDYSITGFEQTTDARFTDSDMERGCNLISKLPAEVLSYPFVEYQTEGKSKPKMIAIGDSFFWNLLNDCNVMFDDLHFYYYFNEDHHVPESKMLKIEDNHPLEDHLENADVVLIVITDAQLPRMGWGFFDAVDELQ